MSKSYLQLMPLLIRFTAAMYALLFMSIEGSVSQNELLPLDGTFMLINNGNLKENKLN